MLTELEKETIQMALEFFDHLSKLESKTLERDLTKLFIERETIEREMIERDASLL